MRRTILLVEDDPTVLYGYAGYLRKRGWLPDLACAVVEALQKCAKNHYDVVLTDLNLPGYDGSVLVHWLAENWPETPVIIASGKADLHSWCGQTSPKAFLLIKPFHMEELQELLELIVGDGNRRLTSR